MLTIQEFDSPQELNEFLRSDLEKAYKESSSSFNLAICGGETPLPFYSYMRSNPMTTPDRLMKVFWTDERFVPFDDEWSNCYMPITQWFIREKNVKCFPVNTDLITAKESATEYAKTVTAQCANKLDYSILGMGTDGHIASIFPRHTTAEGLIFSCKHPSDRTERISMNYALLNTTKRTILLIQGKRKRQVLEDATKDLPIHRLLAKMDVTCLYID